MRILAASADLFDVFAPLPASRFQLGLQWFAAEDEGRTEDPTESKIRKAREEGKVAKSVDLVAAVVLLLPVVTIGFLSVYFIQGMAEMLQWFFTRAVDLDPIDGAGILSGVFFQYLLRLTWPVVLVAFLAALLGNLMQVGFLFTLKPITPDFSRIAPNIGRYLTKNVFSADAAFNLAKALVKVLVIGLIAYLNISSEFGKLLHLAGRPFGDAVGLVGNLALTITVQAAVVMILLSLPDYMYQRNKHQESLKMSVQEVKEERKQQEGDPLIKSRLRERMREVLMSNMMAKVPKADVVITNPTHYAIALEWDNQTMVAPVVTAKGMDEVAQKIKSLAKDNLVPVVENKPLARALYASVDVGDAVPEEYWEIVSRILAEVYRLNGKLDAVVV